ncbi:ABC transporter permease [Acinetobacter sp.]|uniref:ABC transporter permease n=1 Tax=Acinetobacter sp. TaxID=472 RepID=UPI00388F4354
MIWIALPNAAGIPSPTSIFQAWNKLALEQGLLLELFRSVVVIWEALILSALISFGVAYLTTADLFKPVGTFIASMRFLGFAGLTFLFTLWTSNGQNLKLALLTFGMTVFLTRSTVDEVKGIPLESIDYARSLGLRGWRITYEIVIRGRLHTMLDLLRQNAAIGWTLVVFVEGLVRSDGGIGAMLLIQGKYFNLSAVFAIQLTILAYGIIQDMMLNAIRFAVCPYTRLNRSDS